MSLTGKDGALSQIENWIASRSPNFVCLADAHCAVVSTKNRALHNAYQTAGLVLGDGMPLILMCKLLNERRPQRVRGADLMRELCGVSAERGYRNFFVGGRTEALSELAKRLTERYPGLPIAGFISPPFREMTDLESREMIRRINQAKPDILWVGLGAPKQELWMAKHRAEITAPVMIGVGAAFDFLSGSKTEAPLWMQRCGCEWLFRMCSEPKRLSRRYLHVVPSFLGLLFIGVLSRLSGAKTGADPIS
ncbi:WecB/TagA/CpsF family glycosyltransferase [Methylocystis heyeri]|uniref:WecB/TagA/CpsF family glycosyltransferase n=1 Tax=Methylocystis heyeri TaxID=391905 RepID=UPI001FEB239D|nr:WecB/TagA/CpsF family glycosyltransferase [Methylocystis heyeri]